MLFQCFVIGLGKHLTASLSVASVIPGTLSLLFLKCLGSQFLTQYSKINLFGVVCSNWFLICCSVTFHVGIHTSKREVCISLFVSNSK